jgi:hypothetical protein
LFDCPCTGPISGEGKWHAEGGDDEYWILNYFKEGRILRSYDMWSFVVRWTLLTFRRHILLPFSGTKEVNGKKQSDTFVVDLLQTCRGAERCLRRCRLRQKGFFETSVNIFRTARCNLPIVAISEGDSTFLRAVKMAELEYVGISAWESRSSKQEESDGPCCVRTALQGPVTMYRRSLPTPGQICGVNLYTHYCKGPWYQKFFENPGTKWQLVFRGLWKCDDKELFPCITDMRGFVHCRRNCWSEVLLC